MSFGENVRLLRIHRGLTAKALAERVSVSPSMISKIEHDAVNPSHDTLRRIAIELHVSLSDLVDPEWDYGVPEKIGRHDGRISVVRQGQRKLLLLPQSGITYQILSPDLQGAAELVWVESEPGEPGSEFIAHERGEECWVVLEGVLHIFIEDKVVVLNKGDCLTFDARLPHRYANEGTEKLVAIYIAVPPAL